MPSLSNSVHESMCRDVAGGMSREAAWRAHGFGSRNSTRFFKRPKIAARVAELQAEFAEGCKLQLAYLQESLLALAKVDPGAYFEKAPHSNRLRVKDITALPPEVRACISDVQIGKGGVTNIKWHDKVRVLEALARTVVGFEGSGDVNVNVALGTVLGRLSAQDQRVLADALEVLPGPDLAGPDVAGPELAGAGAPGAGIDAGPIMPSSDGGALPTEI